MAAAAPPPPQLWAPCARCGGSTAPLDALPDTLPRLPWTPRKGAVATDGAHWGQRKLLVAELRFLTAHAQAGDVVLYAGAAPGEHLHWLATRAFPHLTFHGVDPRPSALRSGGNVSIEEGAFGTAQAAEWAGKAALFISDVRTGAEEECIAADMAAQAEWTETLRPRAALLKFRLPWGGGHSEYLDGTVRPQAYGQGRTTESRLEVTAPVRRRQWDHAAYEERMCWLNTAVRPAPVALPAAGGGAPATWDGATEMAALLAYLASPHAAAAGVAATPPEPAAAAAAAAALSWEITALLAAFPASAAYREAWLERAKEAPWDGSAPTPAPPTTCWSCLALAS